MTSSCSREHSTPMPTYIKANEMRWDEMGQDSKKHRSMPLQ